jgi:Fe-S-cluster containining protein
MDLHFNCTQCGKCCRDIKLPLTVAEAMDWLSTAGRAVQIICEALPWLAEPRADDQKAAHRRRRSFATMSGSMPTRVMVILAANLVGPCPNLQADMRCGIYARRPLVCRIFPAEINPFLPLDPANKACPPEAWTADLPLIQRDGRVVDDRVREDIQRSRDTDAREVEIKRRLCAALKINSASLADEGFVVHSPDGAAFLAELARAVDHADSGTTETQWRFISNRTETIASLTLRGAVGSFTRERDNGSFEYLGFRPPSTIPPPQSNGT